MGLSNDLISQFVRVTRDENKTKKETTVYGVARKIDNTIYVKLDGSDLLTPMSTTTDVEDGERVTVLVKDHTATITGNMSSPAARTDTVQDINSRVTTQDSTIKTINSNIATIRSDVDTIDSTVKTHDSKIETMDSTISTQGSKIETMESNISTNASNITTVNSDISNINSQIDNVNSSLTAHDSRITANASNITAQNTTIEAMNSKVTANESSITAINSNISDINTNINNANSNITNINTQISNMNSSLTSVESDVAIFNSSFRIENDVVTGIKGVDTEWIATKSLEADHATISKLDTTYANIDFANIGEAAVEKLFASSGIIKDLVMKDGYITGELVGVTIKGDLIEGNTIVAEKLVIKGTDGLYYQLNANGEKIEAQQTEYNSLNGSVITAQSVTANKIYVTDLSAFNATIGGFKLTEESIYSGVKSSIDNTTTGIYLDKEGQIAFGNADNFVKYYQDQNGKYQLIISAESLKLGSGKTDVATAITQNKEAIELKASKTEVTESINNSAASTLESAKSYSDSQLSVKADEISATVTQVKTTADSASASAKKANDAIGDASTEGSILYRMTSAETNITQNADEIQLRAKQTDLNALSERVSTAETNITQNADEIELRAKQDSIDTLTGRIDTAESTFTQRSDEISSEVSGYKDETDSRISGIEGDVSEVSSRLTQTAEDITAEFANELSPYKKHIKFSETGISIMDDNGEENIELALDSGMIRFRKNGEQLGWWDGNEFHTGNIVIDVTERAQFGNFAFVPRSDGSLSFLKIDE